MQADSDLDKRKLLSAGCHASIFISALIVSVGIPVAIMFVSEDAIVKENAIEAINFHLNVWAIGVVITVLSFITFGLLGLILAPIWLIYHWGLSIWAVIHALNSPDKAFRYPFIFRLI